MVTFKPIIYKYLTTIKWKKEHEGSLTSSQKHDIKVGCPPEFGGKQEYWSPEELFVASAELCIMTTFIDLCKRHKCSIISYESRAEGVMHVIKREFRFSHITIWPVIVVPSSEYLKKAADLLAQAKDECVISRSLKTEVHVEPKLEVVR